MMTGTIRGAIGTVLAGFAAISVGFVSSAEAQTRRWPLPDGVAMRSVVIWSEGTRMAGDLYFPEGVQEGDKLPAIVTCNGWGGTKAGSSGRIAARLAAAGYVTLAFDYRGWGESDGKLVVRGEMPEPDENGEVTVRAQVIREVVDPLDEGLDILNAIDFIEGEPMVDRKRIGIWGTSFGGGLVVWTATRDERVKCVVAQVASMGGLPPLYRQAARQRAIDQSRGVIDPIPQGIDSPPGLRGTAHAAKMLYYDARAVADQVNVPLLVIDAENEELMDRRENGLAVYEIVKGRGVPAKYHVAEGITHYQIYREKFDEAAEAAIEWYDEHLKGDAAAKAAAGG
jgi:dipeptidyl aminopeptidase/acylaminoacyl peptidase